MTRFLIFLFPATLDLVLGGIFFVCAARLAQSGESSATVTAVVALWSIAYMITSQVAGHIVKPGNAAKLMVTSCVSIAVLSVLYILLPGKWCVFGLMTVLGVATALFFTPFQVFMKSVEQGTSNNLCRSTAFYTFSWSAGMAAGPFVAGFMLAKFPKSWCFGYEPWQWCYAIYGVVAVLTGLGVWMLKHHADHAEQVPQPEADTVAEIQEVAEKPEYGAMPDLAWVGWVGAGIGVVTVIMIRSLFPATGEALNISKYHQGNVLGLLSGTQAVVGLLFFASRKWMYRALPVTIFGIVGMIGAALFAVDQDFLRASVQSVCDMAGWAMPQDMTILHVYLFYAAAVLFGVYSGSFFFYFVFHSLVHPSRSAKYVSVNESIVGVSGIVGPMAGGWLADTFMPNTPYWVGLVAVAVAVCFQCTVHARYSRHIKWDAVKA